MYVREKSRLHHWMVGGLCVFLGGMGKMVSIPLPASTLSIEHAAEDLLKLRSDESDAKAIYFESTSSINLDSWSPARLISVPSGEETHYLLDPKGEGFQWAFHPHAPMLTPEGTLLLFDNGNFRASA